MLFSILDVIDGMLFKIEPYSAFIRKHISFNVAFTFSHGNDGAVGLIHSAAIFWVPTSLCCSRCWGPMGSIRDNPALERITDRDLGVWVRKRTSH